MLGKSFFCQYLGQWKEVCLSCLHHIYQIAYICICAHVFKQHSVVWPLYTALRTQHSLPTADGGSLQRFVRVKDLQWESTNKRLWKFLSTLCNMFILLLEQNFKYKQSTENNITNSQVCRTHNWILSFASDSFCTHEKQLQSWRFLSLFSLSTATYLSPFIILPFVPRYLSSLYFYNFDTYYSSYVSHVFIHVFP